MDEFLAAPAPDSGPCEINIDLLAAGWNDNFFISQYNDRYSLNQQVVINEEECYKVTISKETAEKIITRIPLKCIMSGFFRNARTYRSKENIESEIKRFKLLEAKLTGELDGLRSILDQYSSALNTPEKA